MGAIDTAAECFQSLCHACNGSGYDCFDDRQCDMCGGAGGIETCPDGD